MSDEEIFDEAMQDCGGLWMEQPMVLAGFRKMCFNRLDLYRSNTGLIKPLPHIIHDFYYDAEFGAWTFRYKQCHIIGMSDNLFWVLFRLFNHMMAQKSFRPDIGDASKGLEKPTLPDYKIDGPHWLGPMVFSDDNLRINRALHYTNLACTFIFEHEVTHILHGHNDYFYDVHRLRLSEHIDLHLYNTERQTAEMLADQGGLFRSAYLIRDMSLTLTETEKKLFFSNVHEGLVDLFFAIYNVFRLYGNSDYDVTIAGKKQHPQSRLRQVLIMGSVPDLVRKLRVNFKVELDEDKFIKDIRNVIFESEKVYTTLTGKQSDLKPFQEQYWHRNPMINQLGDYWDQILRPKLLKYAYVPLPITGQ